MTLSTFSDQVDFLHKNIDHLRNEGVARLHSDFNENRSIERRRHEELSGQQSLLSKQAETYDVKHVENWKNLRLYLDKCQLKQDKAFANAATDVQIGTATMTDKLKANEASLQNWTTLQAEANRRLLIWLICLSAITIIGLGAILYKLFIHF